MLGDDPEKVGLDYVKGGLATGDNICDHYGNPQKGTETRAFSSDGVLNREEVMKEARIGSR